MARDMHDNLRQVLGFINLQAQGIRKELADAGIKTASQKLDRLVAVTQSVHDEIREYISNIRSVVYMERDFISALKNVVSDFEEQAELSVKLDIADKFTVEELKPNIGINILNIVKEALNNVRKHAEAENVKISFSQVHGQLHIAVEDDGKGFDSTLADNTVKNKFGLSIMRERTSEIGARIDIESASGKGCRIVLCVPVGEEKKKNEDEIDAGR